MARFILKSQQDPELPWKLERSWNWNSLAGSPAQHPSPHSACMASGQVIISDGHHRAPTYAYLQEQAATLQAPLGALPAPGLPVPDFKAWGKPASSSSSSETCSTGAPEEAETLSNAAEEVPIDVASALVKTEFDSTPSGGTRADRTLDSLSTEGFTTLMVRNLPHNINQGDLVKELDNSGFQGLHDFVYMPSVFTTGRGKGFAFVNFLSSEAARLFMSSWHKTRRFAATRHKKTLDISVASLQGLEANVLKWDDSKKRRVINPNYRPVVRVCADHVQPPSVSSPPGLSPPRLDWSPEMCCDSVQPLA